MPATARFSAALVAIPIAVRAAGLMPACAASFSCWPRWYSWYPKLFSGSMPSLTFVPLIRARIRSISLWVYPFAFSSSSV